MESTITFHGDGSSGSTTTDSGGHYTFPYFFSTPGTHKIELHYAGDSDHESSSAKVDLIIKPAAPATPHLGLHHKNPHHP